MFGCSYAGEGSGAVSQMTGLPNTFMDGFILDYSNDNDANHSVDVLGAGNGELLFESHMGSGRVTAYADNNYRAICSTTLIGGLLEQNELNKNVIMGRYILFLMNRGVIEGTITNNQDNPVSGAIISAGMHSTISNADGSYSLTLPAGADYTVSVTHTEHQDYTHSSTIGITAANIVGLDIEMTYGTGINNELSLKEKNHLSMACYPNPFNPRTTLSFAIKNPDYTSLEIYNIKGELIRSLYEGYLEQGNHSFVWDGKDKNGSTQSSGIYFTRLKSGNVENTKKIVMIK